jgi:hypothetical protein
MRFGKSGRSRSGLDHQLRIEVASVGHFLEVASDGWKKATGQVGFFAILATWFWSSWQVDPTFWDLVKTWMGPGSNFLGPGQNLDGSWFQLFGSWSKFGWVLKFGSVLVPTFLDLVKTWMGPGSNFLGPGQNLDGSWIQFFGGSCRLVKIWKSRKKFVRKLQILEISKNRVKKVTFSKNGQKSPKKPVFLPKKHVTKNDTKSQKNASLLWFRQKWKLSVYILYMSKFWQKKSFFLVNFNFIYEYCQKWTWKPPIDFFLGFFRVLNDSIERFPASFSPPYFVSFFRRTQKWENSRSNAVSFGPL